MIMARQIRSKIEIEIEIHRRALEMANGDGDNGYDIPRPNIVELEYDGPAGALWDLGFVNFSGARYIEAAAREVSGRWDLLRVGFTATTPPS